MDRSKLHIGTYFLKEYACTREHIRDLAACGIDLVFCMQNDRAALDLFEEYGIGAVVSGVVPGWFGGNGDNAGTMETENPLSAYRAGLARFENHPAIWGIDAGDEPSSLDFPYYGRVLDLLQEALPEKLIYLNIYPGYGMLAGNSAKQTEKELGTARYEEYLDRYLQHTHTDYLSFDHYMFSSDAGRLQADLQTAAGACKKAGRSLWIVLQVNSSDPEKWLSEEELRFQAYTAMGFGAECITWACYTAGWWYNQVLDAAGEKTEQYEKLKRVNRELKAMAEPYMRYRRVDTVRLSTLCGDADHGVFRHVAAEEGVPILLSRMEEKRNEENAALFICAAEENGGTMRLSFDLAEGMTPVLYAGEERTELKKQADGRYRIELAHCRGGLLTAEKQGVSETV